MPLYKIPLWKRVVNVTENATCFPKKIEILHIDAVGIFLLYDEESQKNVNFIRRHRVFREHGKCLIEAGNLHRAIKRFYIKHEGARIGGQQREAKALWIDNEEYIFELPHCELMHRNREGEFICGKPLKKGDNSQGERGMCVLEGYDTPENCVISEFYDNWRQKGTPFVMVEGFKVVKPLSY